MIYCPVYRMDVLSFTVKDNSVPFVASRYAFAPIEYTTVLNSNSENLRKHHPSLQLKD